MDTGVRGDLAVTVADFLARAAQPGRWPDFVSGATLKPDAQTFLRGVYDDAGQDEVGELGVDDLIELAHDFWRWRSGADPKTRGVRIRPGIGADGRRLQRDILEIAGPDLPFLVDSVMGELVDQGLSALAMVHPVINRADTGAQSYIQIHLPALSAVRAGQLEEGVQATLGDVSAAVADYPAMRQRMMDCAEQVARARAQAPNDICDESVALLRWLADDHFTFLGARDYLYARDASGRFVSDEPVIVERSGVGLLKDPARYVLRTTSEPFVLTPEIQKLFADPTPLIVAKSTLRSRVHRRVSADYIGVKRYDEAGAVIGETRFVGLFSADAYNEPTRVIPMVRRKAAWVVEQAGFAPGGHSEKSLRNILENYPRDEMWQITREELLRIAKGVLHLLDRPRARSFNRRDPFNRFITALAYLPKERFNSQVREAVGRVLEEAYGGRIDAFYPMLNDGPLARVFYVIGDIDKSLPDPDQRALDDAIAALTRTWEDDFGEALAASPMFDSAMKEEIAERYRGAFSAAYRERYLDPQEALTDIAEIAKARDDESVRVRAYRIAKDDETILRCKIYSRGEVLPLSATLPIFENLGLFVAAEVNCAVGLNPVSGKSAQEIHIHEIKMRAADGAPIDLAKVEDSFEAAFTAIWTGQAENDGFNRIILKLGAPWREAALLRALARFRLQTGFDPSQAVQEEALTEHHEIAALILGLFRVRFDPALPEPIGERAAWAAQIEDKIAAALNDVASLDSDRVLRRITRLVGAILRTNFYQAGPDGAPKAAMSFKIDSRALEDLPAPKPYREIWVCSPQVEGVHLRFGAVARGGLRWSDRRDDFRTEILDLVKAQQVKNAIIVPVGAKGGFFPKRLPPRTAPGFREAGVEAYKTFLRSLLDITDNIQGESVVPPRDVVRWDDDDPYLVVAADKGTATFSDIANSIPAEYGHWLGDAFASGGSAGYDHKEMGITAKGAWEAVKRHFREMGKNIQEEAFTVIGVGDMSGDVFGNGMLLSQQIKLIAAFDHRDIFIDPDPDPARSWAERKRLFDLPTSSWQSYDATLISSGGGVFSRTLKAIPLSPQLKAMTGLTAQTATPTDLIHALLKSQCELLWFGGIGAYVKAKSESHMAVGDKANDALRVDAEALQAAVIGEGANLGVTQAGRIAFAKGGGRINTDAVDNSAGVDTSDHEVNIKILLTDAIRTGDLAAEARDGLLAQMTDDVGRLVLKDNYDQTLALTLMQTTAANDLDACERMMQRLERAGKLDRAVEGLPTTEDIRELRAAKRGLTRPELAKLMAYAKIDLFDALTASPAPDDPHFEGPLTAYFPPQLGRFESHMRRHRLRREIIATAHADDLVNLCGATFVDRVRETVRADVVPIACAFEAGRAIFRMDDLVARINALDNQATAALQTELHLAVALTLKRLTTYLTRRGGVGQTRTIADAIAFYQPAVDAQRATLWSGLTTAERRRTEARRDGYETGGAPGDLAADAAALFPLTSALDIADLAARRGWPAPSAAFLYRAIGDAFDLDRLIASAAAISLDQHWDRLALRRGMEDLYGCQAALADAAIAASTPVEDPSAVWAVEVAERWAETVAALTEPARRAIAELEAQGPWTFAKVMIAAAELHAVAGALQKS
ncbi:MAG: NAD-glutamate dehydrogenase [Alphaproteobacteria bacterium]|nr:NAD-glutamate dehydrogenase [Alphaproteobacteria bacterium]